MDQFKQATIKANNIDITYFEKGDGPLMLCLHGFPDHPLSFHHQLNYFSSKGYRVVTPYMRGYSPSQQSDNLHFQTAALGLDVIELIKALGYDSAIVIGHDWGAAAANTAAIISPQHIKKMVTSAVTFGTFSSALMNNNEQQKKSWYMYFFMMPFSDMAFKNNDFSMVECLWRDWSYNCPIDEMKRAKDFFIERDSTVPLDYYRHNFNPSFHNSALTHIQNRIGTEKINVPTLHIHGKQDGCIGVELCENLNDYYSNEFKLELVEKAGHFVHIEQHESFNNMVYDFITKP